MKNREAQRLETRQSEILHAYRADERRLHERDTVSTVTRAQVADRWHACEIRSISAAGALCRGLPPLDCSDRIILESPDFQAVEATIVRSDGGDVALEFDLDATARDKLAAQLKEDRAAA